MKASSCWCQVPSITSSCLFTSAQLSAQDSLSFLPAAESQQSIHVNAGLIRSTLTGLSWVSHHWDLCLLTDEFSSYREWTKAADLSTSASVCVLHLIWEEPGGTGRPPTAQNEAPAHTQSRIKPTQKLFLLWAAIWCSRHFCFIAVLLFEWASKSWATAHTECVSTSVFIRKMLVVFCYSVNKRGSDEILLLNPFGVTNVTVGFGKIYKEELRLKKCDCVW